MAVTKITTMDNQEASKYFVDDNLVLLNLYRE